MSSTDMVRSAKALQSWVIKFCNPKWIPPVQGASGTQFADSLEIVRKHVYSETSTKKVPMSSGWTPSQWHVFVHLGLPKGSFVM